MSACTACSTDKGCDVLKKRIFIFLGILLLSSTLAGCRQELSIREWSNRYGFAEDEVFPLEIGEKYGFPYVDAEINGQQIKMMFDTANMVGISISAELAEQLGLDQTGEMRCFDSGGRCIGRFAVFEEAKVKVFGRENTATIYESTADDIDGFLPPSLLLNYRVTIDYRNKLMGIAKTGFPEQGIRKEVFPLIVNPLNPGMPVIAGFVNGEKVLILLDTGSSRTCVDERLVNKLNLPANERGYEIKEVRLGAFRFRIKNAKKVSLAGISERYPGPIMLILGSDTIAKVVFTVDYPNQKVIISE